MGNYLFPFIDIIHLIASTIKLEMEIEKNTKNAYYPSVYYLLQVPKYRCACIV